MASIGGFVDHEEMTMFRKSLIAAFAGSLLFAGVAHAHPRLLSTTPAAGSTGAAPRHIDLRFSERLIPRFSGADLTMAHAKAKVAATAALGSDGKTLSVVPAAQLRSGIYRLDYHVVSSDTHRAVGSLVFRVR
ncbi:MAG: copper homeostasis periplasmic binding protein CopC [Sphingomonas sp.]